MEPKVAGNHSVCSFPGLQAWGLIHFAPTQEVDSKVDTEPLMVRADSKEQALFKEMGSRATSPSPHGEAEEAKARVPRGEVSPQSQGGSHQEIPPFLRLRSADAWAWWEQHASPEILQLLAEGVEPNFCCPLLPVMPQGRSVSDQEAALQIMAEYIQQGAAKEVSMQGTSYLVPWFVLKKSELGGRKSD